MPVLHYQIYGEQYRSSGVVVLLHGLFGMSDNLSSLAKQLAAQWMVVVPDLINHGRSPQQSLMTYLSMANDVLATLSSLHIDRFSLLGHSMGGKVAMQIATLQPDNVERLIVVDIAPVTYIDRHSDIILALGKALDVSIKNRQDIEVSLQALGVENALIPFFIKNAFKDESGKWCWRFALDFIDKAYVNLAAAPTFIQVYSGEVLFIKGQLSDYILPAYEHIVNDWFPHARLKVIHSVGHWLHVEKPMIFKKIVEDFLAQSKNS